MVGLLFAFSLVVISQAGPLIRLSNADPLAICFWRMFIASSILCLILLYQTRRQAKLRGASDRTIGAANLSDAISKGTLPADGCPTGSISSGADFNFLGKLTGPERIALCAAGFLMFLHFFSFLKSVQETTVGNATILCCLNPVFTAIGAFFVYHERPHFYHVLSIAFGLCGILALFSNQVYLEGNAWGICSAITFSIYLLISKTLRLKMTNVSMAFGIYAQTAIYAALAMLIFKVPFGPYDAMNWLSFTSLAIFPTLLGHALITYSLNYFNINFISCATLVEPPLAMLTAAYFLNEPVTLATFAGLTLSTISVLVLHYPYFASLVSKLRNRSAT